MLNRGTGLALLFLPVAFSAINLARADGVDLYVTEARFSSEECMSPSDVSITDVDLGQGGAKITIANPTVQESKGALVLDLVVGENTRRFWVPATIPAEKQVTFEVDEFQAVEFSGATLCGAAPDGIVDAPEPVITVRGLPPTSL